jgi:radical SAM superfamily enzyme YgiQ (UPF0313 family)
MYGGKDFKIIDEKIVFAAIEEAPRETRRVFLCDGDAMALPSRRLIRILDKLNEHFPRLQRVGIYCWPPNIRRKSDAELLELKKRKLSIAYIGLESGDETTLENVRKGCSARENIDCVKRLAGVGIKSSVITLLGVGTQRRSYEHAKASAAVLSQMDARYISFLTVTAVAGTVMQKQIEEGQWEEVSPRQSLQELRWILEDLEVTGSIVRANHASSYLPLGGTFPKDKEKTLQMVDAALAGDIGLKPEWMRGL